jgi:PST family polysaccharide transporter
MSGDRGRMGRIGGGLVWSAASNAFMRLASLATGVVLARLLVPEEFGVFAVALVVQAVLINLAELGLAADLVRHGDIDRRGPTITTVAVGVSGLLTMVTWWLAGPFTRAMGTPEAEPVVQVLGLTLLTAGLTVVPYAQLQREFAQKKLFLVEGASFALGTTVTLWLCLEGHGAISIAIGRVAGAVISVLLQYALTGRRLRFGWRPDVAVSGLRFGVPLALAGVLSWTLINVDTLVVGAVAGVGALGYYVLAFNVASWPSSILGNAIRAVAFPAFAQRAVDGRPDVEGLRLATALTWAAALPVALGLVIAAHPIIEVLYGPRWLPAAAALAALGTFGALRVLFEVWVAFLTACGAARTLITVQLSWLVLLVPAMYVGVRLGGISGAAWAHTVVAALLMAPLHLALLRSHGGVTRALLGALAPGTLAALPAAVASWSAAQLVEAPALKILTAAVVMIVIHGALLWRWQGRVREQLRLAAAGQPHASESVRP